MQIAGKALQDKLNADPSDWQGPHLPCCCGRPARYAGRHRKTVLSALGPLALCRAYYHCSHCERGFFPRDRALGLAGSSLSPAVTRMAGNAAARVSFQAAAALLAELAGLRLSAKRVERAAEALGREIAADERAHALAWGPREQTQYLGMDGTGVPMRRPELAGRAGKQPDGSAKTREAKLVTCWTVSGLDRQGRPRHEAGSVSYSAAIETAACRDTDPQLSPFAQRVLREARRRRFPEARRRVVIADGAPWIWKLATEAFPGAVQVLDLYHAKQHLSEVAKAVYPADPAAAQVWASQRHEDLDQGRIETLLAALRQHSGNCETARLCADYVASNRQRMRYQHFRAAGLCVGSGVVEAGCKVIVGSRLKGPGMHWSVDGANAILALRCCHLSGRFEDFWERRSESM